MNLPMFEEIGRDAYRCLEDAEEILRLPWRGESPTAADVDALDDVRHHIADAKNALARIGALRHMKSHTATESSLTAA